ncbi:MAG: serine palmitoyltransferase, partial [Parasphingopyxis sp.]
MNVTTEQAIAPETEEPRAADLFDKFAPLIQERANLLATGVRDPFAIVMDEVKSPTEAVIDGKDTILLGTYNYMG